MTREVMLGGPILMPLYKVLSWLLAKPRIEKLLGSAGKSPAVTPVAACADSDTLRTPRSVNRLRGSTSMEAGVSRTLKFKRDAEPAACCSGDFSFSSTTTTLGKVVGTLSVWPIAAEKGITAAAASKVLLSTSFGTRFNWRLSLLLFILNIKGLKSWASGIQSAGAVDALWRPATHCVKPSSNTSLGMLRPMKTIFDSRLSLAFHAVPTSEPIIMWTP